jgi:hypothetical protein
MQAPSGIKASRLQSRTGCPEVSLRLRAVAGPDGVREGRAFPQFVYDAASVDRSTFTPGPMVEVMATRFT